MSIMRCNKHDVSYDSDFQDCCLMCDNEMDAAPEAIGTHYGDPCIHCGTAHDAVSPGACAGDPKKARVISYCVERQAHQNPGSRCDTILCLMSTGVIETDTRHPTEHWWNNDWFKGAQVLSRDEFHRLYKSFN